MSEITCKPSQAVEFLKVGIKRNRPVFFNGPPGVGKTEIVKQTAAEMGYECIPIIAAQQDPVDVKGLPYKDAEGNMQWATPSLFKKEGKVIFFFDELPNAPTMVQNSLQQVILERRIGEFFLHPDIRIVGAGNRIQDRAGAGKLTTAQSSRFLHLNFEVDIHDWSRWAVTADIHPMTIAFLRHRPELLHQFNKDHQTFPCPRTWQFASDITHESFTDDIKLALYAGTVGEGAAIEYLAYEKIYKSLPAIDAILMNPSQAEVPTDIASLYAVSSALGRFATPDNFTRVLTYLDRLSPEYNVMAVNDAITRDTKLQNTTEFTTWAIKHSDIVS